MCYIFNCFGWALDFIQRVITFMLACLMYGVVCLGLTIAIAAGIAYGYNYSMAEFLSFTRQDVTVYMQRGQFYDKPDSDLDRGVYSPARMSKGEDMFGMNKTSVYKDFKINRKVKPMWDQLKDTRQYAEVLTKYLSQTDLMKADAQFTEDRATPPPLFYPTLSKLASSSPTSNIVSTLMQSGLLPKIMSKFQPVRVYTIIDTTAEPKGDYFYEENKLITTRKEKEEDSSELVEEQGPTRIGLPNMEVGEMERRTIAMRIWTAATRKRETIDEIYAEEVDGDNVIYKTKSV